MSSRRIRPALILRLDQLDTDVTLSILHLVLTDSMHLPSLVRFTSTRFNTPFLFSLGTSAALRRQNFAIPWVSMKGGPTLCNVHPRRRDTSFMTR